MVEDVFNFPAARAEQADGGAEVGFRRGDFHKHKRLQRRDLCGFKGGAQGDARSHMVARDRGAVTPGHGGDFDVRILKGVTGNGIGLERVFHALPDSINEGGGQDGRIDGEPDLVARTAFTRGDGQGDFADVRFLAELAVEYAGRGCRALRRFAADDLRLAHAGRDAVFAADALKDYIKMELAHAGHDAVAGPFVDGDGQGRIFKGEAVEGFVEGFAFVGVAGLDGEGDDGLVGFDGLQQQFGAGSADGIAGARRAQTDDRHDVPGFGGVHLLTAIGVEAVEPRDAFVGALGDVAAGIALFQCPGIQADKGQLAPSIHHDLEHQPCEGQGGIAGNGP